MRQLQPTKQPTDPAWATDQAQALPLLRSLAAAPPLPVAPVDMERLPRFIVAVATQYRRPGAPWKTLLTAGFEAAAEYLARPGQDADYLDWRVRQAVVGATLEL